MRIFPLITAIAVAVLLYFAIIERDRALEFLGLREPADVAQNATDDAENPAREAKTENLIKVVAQHSVAQKIDSAVVLRGQTQAARQVDVRSETSATVLSAPLRKGTFVETGQLLCQLDPGTRGATLAEAKARLAEARARLSEAESRVPESRARILEANAVLEEAMTNQNAATKLSVDGFASDTRVKSANAQVAAAEASIEAANSGLSAARSGIQSAAAGIESAQATVAAAQKELSRLDIKAPFAGLLESDTAELGSLLQPGSLCSTVIQLDPIKLVAFAPETEVDRIELGATAGARLAAGGAQVVGKVTFLSRSADPTTRTFRVEIEVPNKDLKIRDGQTAEILIGAAGAQAHLVPGSALTLNNDGALGLRAVDDTGLVQFHQVEMLRDTVDGVWLAGLPDTLDIIVVGQDYVTAGVKVAPTFREVTQ
ncbi:efflux RND transporter periplasmic adaptor subunit [Pseudosulfitobacter sp. SM2401]|uniref:efflux RND transporter periplasmic adaptor subunit n=1 Tax=Pseudosulfitobacter sp. SM2401 TaxID=3350098 RepID=UPI0036F2DD2D